MTTTTLLNSNPCVVYMDAISLAEAQLKEAKEHLEALEMTPGSRNLNEQRQVVQNLHQNLVEMKSTYVTIFGTLPPIL